MNASLEVLLNSAGVSDRSHVAGSSYSNSGIGCTPQPCCSWCGQVGDRLYADLVDCVCDSPGCWGIRECRPCGIAWLDPQPAAEDIPKLYSGYYTHRLIPRTRFDGLRDAVLQRVLRRMGYCVEPRQGILAGVLSHMRSSARASALEVLDLRASEVGTILDVGCGNGAFLVRMRSLGWKVFGVDPDPEAVIAGRNQELQVFCGTILDVPDTNRYDVITLSHVIEHAVDPVDLLRECKRRLRPGTGRVIITTPNINSLGHRWFSKYWRGLEVPRHLNLFSPKGLSHCVTRAGLILHSLSTETRMGRMIYNPSVYAKKGKRNLGQFSQFRVTTKTAAYLFQLLEDGVIRLKHDAGEEIFCVCTAPMIA